MSFSDQKFFEFPDPWNKGKMLKGFFVLSKYWYNQNLSVQIYAEDKDLEFDDRPYYSPYCSVSVNLVKVSPQTNSCIFVDNNNAPWLEEFLSENGFGLPTGRFATSGYCNYPEYMLNLKKMKRYAMREAGVAL